MDFAHVRTARAREGCRAPLVGPHPPTRLHPDTAASDAYERFEALAASARLAADAAREARRARHAALRPSGPLARARPTADPRAGSAVLVPPSSAQVHLDVTAQFDARWHAGDQRGAAGAPVFSDRSKPPAVGPLRTLFDAYAGADDDHAWLTSAVADKTTNKKPSSLMSRAEATSLLEDFDVVPRLVSRRDANRAFRAADAPAVGEDAAVNRVDELDFDEFVAFMATVSVLAWHDPSSDPRGLGERAANEATSDEAAADATLECLGCGDPRGVSKLRALIHQKRRLGDRNARDVGDSKRRQARLDRTLPNRAAARPSAEALRRAFGEGTRFQNRKNDVWRFREREPAAFAAITARLLRFERRAPVGDVRAEHPGYDAPRWTSFAAPAVDCGTLAPGIYRRFRVRVARPASVFPGDSPSGFARRRVCVETVGLPCVEATFAEGALAPGLSKIVELVAGAEVPGEWLGFVVVRFREEERGGPVDAFANATRSDHFHGGEGSDADAVFVPVYLNVVDPSRALAVSRRDGSTRGVVKAYEREPHAESSKSPFKAPLEGDATAMERRLAVDVKPSRVKAARGGVGSDGASALRRGSSGTPPTTSRNPRGDAAASELATEASAARLVAEAKAMRATVRSLEARRSDAATQAEMAAEYKLSKRGLRY